MYKQKDTNILVVGPVISTATTKVDEVRLYPASRLTVEDVAPLMLTADEVLRIAQTQG